MQEIKCPKCGEVFQVDESGYAAIVKQVRDKEFSKELQAREKQFATEKETAVRLAKLDVKNAMQDEITQLEQELQKVNQQTENILHEKELSISDLKAQLKNYENEKELAVKTALSEQEKQLTERDKQILQLESRIENKENEFKLAENKMIEKYEAQLKEKEETINYYKDFKLRQSTKMIGESLEQHCEMEFNKLRATGFQKAYFEKDNDIRTGSKGDYIYREFDTDGTEFISIMFEMKNEMNQTATKHKNEDFLKELDKDRNEKKCEYAVLVSLLEPDNDYYNTGIVDMSYRYEKMYVIRPQFFIPMISLLRNAAANSLKYKKELALIQNQNIDITHFEQDLNDFKTKFSRNYRLASEKFNNAIKEIDTSIAHLQKIKDSLLSSDNQLRLANEKAQDLLTIKKLTEKNPTMAEKFNALHDSNTWVNEATYMTWHFHFLAVYW